MKINTYGNGRAVFFTRYTRGFVFALIFILLAQLAVFFSPISVQAEARLAPTTSIPFEGFLLENPSISLPSVPADISARSCVLINADTGDVLYRQNENVRLPMASTTKVMTALVALDAMAPDTEITVTAASVGIEGSSIYLTEGEVLSLESLLYALLLSSANDAASAIAIGVAGNVSAFADLMNQKAAALGLKDTHFVNPHGLDAPEHYTTAYELAVITQAAMSHELFRTIVSTRQKTIPHHAEEGVRWLINHNKLLRSYDGVIGVKTGFTKKSGRCLVSAAQRDGTTLIAVTINAPNDWQDHTKLLDYGFSLYEPVSLCLSAQFQAPIPLVGGTTEYVMAQNRDCLTLSLPKVRGQIRCVVELPRFLYAPVQQDQIIGHLAFYEISADGNNVLLEKLPIYAQHDTEARIYEKSLLEQITDFFGF